MSGRLLLIYLLSAALLQGCLGNFPMAFMAFPLNVLFALVWLTLLVLFYRQNRNSRLMRHLLSGRAALCSIVLFILACLPIGLLPQYSFQTSWLFLAVLLLLQSHLVAICLRGWRNDRGIRWRFLLNHVGLWLALFAAFWGAPDEDTFRLSVGREEAVREGLRANGSRVYLDYDARLLHFDVDYFDNGVPSCYEACVALGTDTVTLLVNHPYARGWCEDVYLSGYDTRSENTTYCILQVVREPWKWLNALGIWMMLAGGVLLFIQGPVKKTV